MLDWKRIISIFVLFSMSRFLWTEDKHCQRCVENKCATCAYAYPFPSNGTCQSIKKTDDGCYRYESETRCAKRGCLQGHTQDPSTHKCIKFEDDLSKICLISFSGIGGNLLDSFSSSNNLSFSFVFTKTSVSSS